MFSLDDNPGLLRIFPVAWNKAYRREYLNALGLEFAVGYYEDVSWTLLTMIRATRIGALDRVCVQYLQRRFGGILQTQTTRHIDVLAQYEAVFSHLEALPSLDERWSPSVHRQMVNHVLAIWEHPRRLPPEFRKEFFRIAAQRSRKRCPSRGFEYSGSLTSGRQAVAPPPWQAKDSHHPSAKWPGRFGRFAGAAPQFDAVGRIQPAPFDSLASGSTTAGNWKLPIDPNLSCLLCVLERWLPVQSPGNLRESSRTRAQHSRGPG